MLLHNTEQPLREVRPPLHQQQQRPQNRTTIEAEREALSSMLDNLRRNVRLIALITLLGASGVAALVILAVTPQYSAVATVLVDSRKTQILKDQEVVGRPGTENSAIESEAEMLKSPALLRRVAEAMRLDQDQEFRKKPGVMSWVRWVISAPLRGGLRQEDGPADPMTPVVEALDRKVHAKRRNMTYVIELSVWSTNAHRAAAIANKIADLYLVDQIAAKSAAAEQATKWLNDEIEQLRSKVTSAEMGYERYKAEAGLFATGGENLNDRQISSLNEQLVMSRARVAEAQAKYQQLQTLNGDKLRSAAASPDILQSPVLSNLRNQHAEVARKNAELTSRYGPRHPQVIAVQAEQTNLAKQISEEVNRIVASARTEYEMAKSREDSLGASLDELKGKAGDFHQKSVRLRELEREATANRSLLEGFLVRAKETAAQLNMQMPDSRILSAAIAPLAPSYPQKMLMIGLGFFASLGLGIFLALVRGMMSEGFRRAGELQTAFGLKPLATIPLVESTTSKRPRPDPATAKNAKLARFLPDAANPDRHVANLVLREPNSLFSESIQSLRLALRHAGFGREIKVLQMTSALPGEGKSTIAANLARACALCGDSVLLIDADLRRPNVAANIGLPGAPGLAEVLGGTAELRNVVRRDSQTGLDCIAGDMPVHGTEALTLLSSRGMTGLIDLVRGAYDVVIIDSAPLLPVADPRVLVSQVDGVALVVASELTSRSAVQAALQETPGIESKILGAVMNRVVNDYGRNYAEYGSLYKVA
jgi:succinoglycan biosynthesis transport protein ExoP